MASSTTQLLLLLISFTSCSILASSKSTAEADPTPTPWPPQFHSLVLTNQSGDLQVIDLWYDWPNGRNLNIIQYQLAQLLYSFEWTNGTSFFYTTTTNNNYQQEEEDCSTSQFEVGILPPNWLEGANYLGQRQIDGFLCNVWEKVDGFIYYYEDVLTKRPVYWLLFNGRASHVMTFEVGAVLEDAKWQAPAICFEKQDVNADLAAGIRADMGFQNRLTDGILRGSMQY